MDGLVIVGRTDRGRSAGHGHPLACAASCVVGGHGHGACRTRNGLRRADAADCAERLDCHRRDCRRVPADHQFRIPDRVVLHGRLLGARKPRHSPCTGRRAALCEFAGSDFYGLLPAVSGGHDLGAGQPALGADVDCGRSDDLGQRSADPLSSQSAVSRGDVEVSGHLLGGHCPGVVRQLFSGGGRAQHSGRAGAVDDRAPGITRAATRSTLAESGLPAVAGRVWHEDGAGADAYLAAGLRTAKRRRWSRRCCRACC